MEKVKKLKRLRLILFFVLIISIIMALMIFNGAEDSLYYVMGAIGWVVTIASMIIRSKAKKELMKLCLQCGASLDGCAYETEELGREEYHGNVYSTVEFSAECPECASVKSFRKKYTVYKSEKYDSSGRKVGNAQSFNITSKVRKDAKKFFGH